MSLTKATYSMISGAPVNVLDYGAIADYSGGSGTDNGPAFQEAIDAAIAKKCALFIPAGAYAIDTGVTISAPLIVYGEGKQNTILWITDSSVDGITIDDPSSTLSYVSLRDFKIGHTVLGTGNAVTIGYDVTSLEFSNFYVEGSNHGIYCANRTWMVTCNNVTAARCNYGIWLSGETGGGGSTIRFNDCYSLSCGIGFYVQYCAEVSFNDCATDFTPTDVASYWGVQCYSCASVYVQNHHAEGVTAGTGPTAANITAALRFDDVNSILVDGLYYDLDGTSGPTGVYAIASQIGTIDSFMQIRGITHGSYIDANSRRIWTNSTSTGQQYLVEFGGDWGLANSYINAGGAAVQKLSFTDGNLQVFGSDDWSTVTRATGVNTGKLYSSSDTSVVLAAVPNSGNVQLEHKDSGGGLHQVVWDAATTSFRVNKSADDNTYSLGASGYRWSVVYAGTGTINTSDRTAKQNIEELNDAEKRVAIAIKGLIKKFKFKDAVEKKGDDARIHVGVIAQEIQSAFETEGLNAAHYGLFCSDELEDGSFRLGVRYEELLAFVISSL